MPTRLSDTDPETARMQVALLARAGPARRVEIALGLSAELIELAWHSQMRASPGMTLAEARLRFVELSYGRELALAVRRRISTGSE